MEQGSGKTSMHSQILFCLLGTSCDCHHCEEWYRTTERKDDTVRHSHPRFEVYTQAYLAAIIGESVRISTLPRSRLPNPKKSLKTNVWLIMTSRWFHNGTDMMHMQGQQRLGSESGRYPPYGQPPRPPPVAQHQRPSMQWHAGKSFFGLNCLLSALLLLCPPVFSLWLRHRLSFDFYFHFVSSRPKHICHLPFTNPVACSWHCNT